METKKRLNDYYRIGLVLIATGLVFAFETLFKVRILYKLWPVIITIMGMGFVKIFLLRKSKEIEFLGIGSYLIFFSFLAFYCNFYSWWHLGKLWPLFITSAGLSFLSIYLFNLKKRMYLLMGLILLSISVVFFIVFDISSKYWWTILILMGISVISTGKDNE
jgi:hypothetical protein